MTEIRESSTVGALKTADSSPRRELQASFTSGPHPLLRINPTPSATMRSSRAGSDARVLEELRILIATQDDTSTELGDLLYDIATEVDHDIRNKVVLPLRRAVHNGRLPPASVATDAVAALRCAPQAGAWLETQQQLENLRVGLLAGYEDALDEERCRLREVLASEPLLQSLGMSSEFLPTAAQRYASAPWAELPKKTRKSEASLLRYAVRAGSKTSPYSQYTAVGFLDDRTPRSSCLRTVSTIEVNRALLRRLEAGIIRLPAVGGRVSLHASAGLRMRDGLLVAHGDRDQLGAEAASIAERFGEAQVTLPASPAVMALLQWLETQDAGSATLDQLAAMIESSVPGADAEKSRGFVIGLVDHGVLAASPIIDDHASNPIETLAVWLTEVAPSEPASAAIEIRDGLRDLADSVRCFASAGPDKRVELIRAGRHQRDAVLRAVGDDVGNRPGPEPVWYEDCQFVDGAPGSTADWSEVLDDCRDMLGVLSIFDEQHVFSRVLTQRFVDRFGHGGTTQELDTLGDIFMPAYGDALQLTEGFDHPLIRTDPVIGELVGLRNTILDPLVQKLRAARIGDDPIELGREWLDVIAQKSPEWVRRTASSHSVFLQPLGGNPPSGAVLNKIYNGWGNYLSRFLTTAPNQVFDAIRANARRHLPAEDAVAELRPVQGFNANIHPLLGDVDLDFDGRGTQGSIPMNRLALRHNPSTERVELWDTGTGRRVHPFYLGFLIPYYLPSNLVPLTAMAGSGSVMFEPQVSADRGAMIDRGTLRHYPRVTFGSLVLARARWHVPAALLPRSEPGGTDAEFFLRLNEWRTTHGLPEHVFFHPPAPELDPGKVNDYFGSYMTNRKPQYVALLSRLHVRHLQRELIEQPGVDVIFEEALPDPSDAFPIAGDRHATEVVAEFYRPACPDPREQP